MCNFVSLIYKSEIIQFIIQCEDRQVLYNNNIFYVLTSILVSPFCNSNYNVLSFGNLIKIIIIIIIKSYN